MRCGGDKRYKRRLIDITQRRMLSANDEVEFVAEDAVTIIDGEMDEQRDGAKRDRRKRPLPDVAQPPLPRGLRASASGRDDPRDSRRSRAPSFGRANRPRRISPIVDRAGISNPQGLRRELA